jgi:hypothetical protein
MTNPHDMDSLLNGTFLGQLCDNNNLNENERTWIASLQQIIHQEIPLHITIKDFKKKFKAKQERTLSSLSGRHMGHYKNASEGTRA